MREEFDMVIMGGDGDLSLRKLLPALYRCERESQLPKNSRVFLVSRGCQGRLEEFQQRVRGYLKESEFDEVCWQRFVARLNLLNLDLSELNQQWQVFADQLNQCPAHTRLFYMAIPPALYGVACHNLAAMELTNSRARVVLEKPIGYDLSSARDINAQVAEYFPEKNIYRIDHYLGKETVQNLLALRFTNVIFEHLWDNKTIDNVQITLSETVGLETRAAFYDRAGALRDMVQNHLLQLLSFIAMDPPNRMNAESIRNEKIKVMQALRPIRGEDVKRELVRGQYVAGELEGTSVPGYLDELGNPDSRTETFVAICAHIDNWRWSGVPFYLRTGKRMQQRYAEIVLQFKPVSHAVYAPIAGQLQPNRLIIRLQPEESIELILMTKALHSQELQLKPVSLNLDYSKNSCDVTPDAYRRLLMDVSDGNSTLFAHRDEVEEAWRWLDPIMSAWHDSDSRPENYAAGSWGPEAADALLARAGHQWFLSGE